MPSGEAIALTLAHVSIAQNQGALTSQQVVETTLDRVIQIWRQPYLLSFLTL